MNNNFNSTMHNPTYSPIEIESRRNIQKICRNTNKLAALLIQKKQKIQVLEQGYLSFVSNSPHWALKISLHERPYYILQLLKPIIIYGIDLFLLKPVVEVIADGWPTSVQLYIIYIIPFLVISLDYFIGVCIYEAEEKYNEGSTFYLGLWGWRLLGVLFSCFMLLLFVPVITSGNLSLVRISLYGAIILMSSIGHFIMIFHHGLIHAMGYITYLFANWTFRIMIQKHKKKVDSTLIRFKNLITLYYQRWDYHLTTFGSSLFWGPFSIETLKMIDEVFGNKKNGGLLD